MVFQKFASESAGMDAFASYVASQTVASPGVLQGVDCQTPSEWGRRRGPSIEIPTPIRDRAVSGRLVIGARDIDRFRTSCGDTSEPLEETLGRIMGEEYFNSFTTGIESAYKSEFAKTEKLLRSELAQAFSNSIQNVVNIANENYLAATGWYE